MPKTKPRTALETEIIDLLSKKQQRGITLLYEHYSPALYNIILRIVQSEEIAEETLQDSYLKIWDNFSKYDSSKGRLFTWMVRICRNLAIDKVRSSQFKKGNRTESIPDSVYNSDSLSEELNTSDPGLRKVVSKMDDKTRILIELLYFKDYTQREVSDALDIPLGTVKSRSRKAIQVLRQVLGNEGFLSAIFITMFETIKRYFGS
ncbi:sigma-70 family RNA polymerase sigma factor [Phaeodactylibacter sp.]|jgi:RNA polymerase sigma-70 factor (ECF subfamily)|uniref:RNA polymerase sigma factor n=1 Tax=Phaeodactylibacter sp. TaxID=1940289 RepID=UPI0025E9D6A4|nr:sigma-70 family RNA polymerase sigma factor [Phaeodactylibacter sp.]MCI4650272.1 sigma-70 family RNA polymerase sigma factor [Phaeodactylibacter sp.]MCI5093551.1 sigma-70 family RNA polymerase sigma factor [Phaeodactylibacter sp.]